MARMEVIFDYDYIKYTLAAAAEKRSIVVTHPSGIEETFNNRTEFYGHWSNKSGGWLGTYNKDKSTPLSVEEFSIVDVQTPEPLEFCLSSVKNHIYNTCNALNIPSYRGYLGKGDSFRVEQSTIVEYKGNRKNIIKPLYLKEVEDYLVKSHDAEIVEHLEADDKCVMTCWKDPSKVLVGVDKDYNGVNYLSLFNPFTNEHINTKNLLGRLESTNKGVKGIGRKFFYHQILSGDSSDNYFANSASDIKWGEKSSYNVLKDLNTDKECWQAIIDCYKKLYPEPKIITGWRGNEFEIDWLYVLNENAIMAHMLRFDGDWFDIISLFDRLGVEY